MHFRHRLCLKMAQLNSSALLTVLTCVIFFTICSASFSSLAKDYKVKLKAFEICLVSKDQSYLITPFSNQSLYKKLNLENVNLQHSVYPLAYFLPRKTSHVKIAVKCGRETNIRVIPKSGGHSYESQSFGTPGTIIIDFRKMRCIRVNKAEGTAVVQPGVLTGTLLVKIWKEGGFGFPTGLCLNVGIGGVVLGGGIGYMSQIFGLSSDNVLEFTMVDAAGQSHTANEEENPDLFWALRGVGSGLIGIVTKLKLKLFKASKINITHVKLNYPINDAGLIFKKFQSWMMEKESYVETDMLVKCK